jgi:hypothetical protein
VCGKVTDRKLWEACRQIKQSPEMPRLGAAGCVQGVVGEGGR